MEIALGSGTAQLGSAVSTAGKGELGREVADQVVPPNVPQADFSPGEWITTSGRPPKVSQWAKGDESPGISTFSRENLPRTCSYVFFLGGSPALSISGHGSQLVGFPGQPLGTWGSLGHDPQESTTLLQWKVTHVCTSVFRMASNECKQ